MNIRNYGIIKAEINHGERRVVLSCKRGPGRVSDSTFKRLAAWAVKGCKDLERLGYEIDGSELEYFFNRSNRNSSEESETSTHLVLEGSVKGVTGVGKVSEPTPSPG